MRRGPRTGAARSLGGVAAVRLALGGVVAVALAVALGGCPESRPRACAPSLEARLELRDGAGALELAVKPSATTGAPPLYDLCDGQHRRTGGLLIDTATITVLDADGKLRVRLHLPPGDDPAAEGPSGPRLRVHRDARELRVLAPDGVPFGSIAPNDAGAQVYDRAGRPIAAVKPRGADQAISDAGGAVTALVMPAASSVAAGAFALPGLSVEERLALYQAFSR